MPGFLGTVGRVVDRLLGRGKHASGGRVASVLASTSAQGGGSTSSGSLSTELSLEQRVTEVEAALAKQRGRLDALQDGLQRESGERQAADAAEQSEREAADARLDQQLVELATGDLRLEAVGVTLFGLGVALSTWSGEIARALS